MSLNPTSPANARALARLIEQERGDLTWWKQGAYVEAPQLNAHALARKCWENWQARWNKRLRDGCERKRGRGGRYVTNRRKAA